MAAGKYNFTIEQGATLDFEIQYKDSTSTPINISGYEAAMQIRSTYSGSGITYLTLTSSIGDVYTKTSGSSFLSLSGSDLSTPQTSGSIGIYSGWYNNQSLTFTGSAYWDLEITRGAERIRLIEGQVQISKQTTQAEPQ